MRSDAVHFERPRQTLGWQPAPPPTDHALTRSPTMRRPNLQTPPVAGRSRAIRSTYYTPYSIVYTSAALCFIQITCGTRFLNKLRVYVHTLYMLSVETTFSPTQAIFL